MKKIAVVSDIHGNISALEKVIEDIEGRQVECVFNLGDHLSGPLYPKETLHLLMKLDWIHILGNHDRQLISENPDLMGPSDKYTFDLLDEADFSWLRKLPSRTTIIDQFLLIHGTPDSDTTYLLETVENGKERLASPNEISIRIGHQDTPIILCGHTHVPRVVESLKNILIINPGSVGLQAYNDVTPEYHVIENGSPHARYAILEFVNNKWQAEIIAVTYDFKQAAIQARKNGRPDWEYALLTGYMPPLNTHKF